MRITRRSLLISGGLVGGAMLLGVGRVAFEDRVDRQRGSWSGNGTLLSVWLVISPDNRFKLLTPHVEMGQGANTGLLQIVADELDCDWSQLSVEQAPASHAFANGAIISGLFDIGEHDRLARKLIDNTFDRIAELYDSQGTGASSSIRETGWKSMRGGAAAAREMLQLAGARRLGVPRADVTTDRGHVLHTASGRRLTYGELATEAAKIPIPGDPPFRDRAAYRYIGRSVPRVDLPAKVFGTARYGMDFEVPNMRYAAIALADVLGASVTAVTNEADILGRRGVESVHIVEGGVAVVADNPWRAEQAAWAVRLTTSPSTDGASSSVALLEAQRAALDGELDEVRLDGDADQHDGPADVEAEYVVPYLSHSPMEVMNATVWHQDGLLQVAAGVQDPLSARVHVAKIAELDFDEVALHPQLMGGGFGRRAGLSGNGFNYLTQAVQTHLACGQPVKMTWSREVDTRACPMRPMVVARHRAKLGPGGLPTAWEVRSYQDMSDGAEAAPLYRVPNLAVRHAEGPHVVPVAHWRSVDASVHCFFVESFVDELARAASQDPLAYRLAMLDPASRHARTLKKVAEMAGWTPEIRDGKALGLALSDCFGSVAQVAEVSLDGKPRVHRVWCAVDCGLVVNPDSVLAQVEGGILFGLTAALFGRIDVEEGRVRQGNFDEYRMVTLATAPQITVHLVESDRPPGGVGECAVPPIAPAVANALARLTERRRTLPLAV